MKTHCGHARIALVAMLRLLSSLLAVLASGTISTGDAKNLHGLYCAAADDGEAPPLAPLEQPAVIELLLHAAFHPDRPCKPELRDQVLELPWPRRDVAVTSP